MNSCELVVSISALACLITEHCSKDEVSILAAAFSQLGDTLATILTHEEICGNKRISDDGNHCSNNDRDTDNK